MSFFQSYSWWSLFLRSNRSKNLFLSSNGGKHSYFFTSQQQQTLSIIYVPTLTNPSFLTVQLLQRSSKRRAFPSYVPTGRERFRQTEVPVILSIIERTVVTAGLWPSGLSLSRESSGCARIPASLPVTLQKTLLLSFADATPGMSYLREGRRRCQVCSRRVGELWE